MSGTSMSKDNGLAAYIGISGPETPKYLLVNNFLSEFFITASNEQKKQYEYQDFIDKEVLNCQEDDEKKRKQLEESFNCFFKRFAGEDIIKSSYKDRIFYFPLHPRMLRSSSYNLRHILFRMIPDIEKDTRFREIQKMLEEYLYGKADGVSYLLNTLCDGILKKMSLRIGGRKGQEFEPLKERYYKKICNHFYEDISVLLTSDFFKKMDFYKRYDYLATLLNIYVIQYIVNKKGVNNRGYILCQGSATSHLLDGTEFHRACVQNYSEIRSVFPQELKEFYIKCLKNNLKENGALHIQDEENIITVNGEPFIEFAEKVFHSKYKDEKSLYQLARRAFRIEKSEKVYTVDEFAMYYIDMTKARKGSVLTKISSALPTSGRDIDFIFPKNQSKHKFFALSPSLLEFYVRLYLAKQGRSYAYLDGFLFHLQEHYGICIQKSQQMDKILRKMHIRIPLSEFRQNEQALLDSLNEINCLIRLSDSGYVITLPEEKGEFKLL